MPARLPAGAGYEDPVAGDLEVLELVADASGTRLPRMTQHPLRKGEPLATTFHALDTDRLEKLSDLPTELAIQRSVPLLAHLASDPAFLDACVLPLQPEAGAREEWYVAHTFDGPDGSYSLQIFVWPARTRTQIHDHTSWGAYCCVVGSVLEERYERLDDGSQLEYAHLKEAWQLSWSREDGGLDRASVR
jgi:hypothetical protein